MIFEELGLKHASEEDCRIVQHVCGLVSTRAAYLVSAGQFIDGVSQSVFRCTSTPICRGSATKYRSVTECRLAS